MAIYARIKNLVDTIADDNRLITEDLVGGNYAALAKDLPQIRMADVMGDDAKLEDFVEQILENIILKVHIPRSTWKTILDVIDKARKSWEIKDRSANKYRIGVEMLFIHSKIDSEELMKYFGTAAFTRHSLYNSRLASFVVNFLAMDRFTLETGQLKNWFNIAIRQKAVVIGLQEVVAVVTHRILTDEQVAEMAETIKIYSFDGNLGYYLGCTLRDGFVIVKCNLPFSTTPTDSRYRAALMTLMLHETSHYFVRLAAEDYGYSSPSSNLHANEKPKRTDTVIPGKGVEAGRCFELKCFGQKQPNWELCDMIVAKRFFEGIITEGHFQTLPLIEPGTHGLVQRDYPSLSFAADLIPAMAHLA